MSIRAKRGTKAQVDAAASIDGLQTGELIYLTDEQKFVGATEPGAYGPLGDRLGEYVTFTANLTISATHANKTLIFTDASINLVRIVNLQANDDVPRGASIRIVWAGGVASVATKIVAGSGVTVLTTGSMFISQNESGELIKLGANLWSFVRFAEKTPAPRAYFQVNAQNSLPSNPSTPISTPSRGEVGDLWLVFCETAAQAVNTPSGFTIIPGLPQTTGTAGGVASTALYGFYRFLDGSESGSVNFAIGGPGDHVLSTSLVVKNVDSVTPFAATSGNVAASATTAVSLPTVTTVRNDNLIICVATNATDTSTPQFSAPVNSNLGQLSILSDYANSAAGNGGSISIVTGVKSAPGATGATTGTLATASVQARWTGAINPK